MYVIDVFFKYAWVKPLMNKKADTVNGFIGIVNESKCKPEKLWVDQGRKFCDNLKRKWLDDNDILMYSTHKSVAAKRSIRTFKAKMYKK